MEGRTVNHVRHGDCVVYLYGFVPATAPTPPAALVGVGDAAVDLLDVDGVCGVIARLPADRYGGDVIDARVQDLQWVGEQGLGHERVVLWFVDHADILPARLFSMYADEDALRAAMTPRAAHIASELKRLGGRREWNLKAAYDPAVLGRNAGAVSDEVSRMDAEIESAAPGRRYLLQRKRADVLKREVSRAARRLADELLDSLRPHAETVHVLPLPKADEEVGSVVLSAALLITRDAEPAARAAAEARIGELGELGVNITFSGPWAPYRFVEADV